MLRSHEDQPLATPTYCLSILEPMQNITTRHVYFLTKILQDSLLTQRLNQSIMAMMGLSGRCEKIIELFCLVCALVTNDNCVTHSSHMVYLFLIVLTKTTTPYCRMLPTLNHYI